MKIVGIIAEYNPFHSGHEYQLRRARELAGADYAVVCMSGSFTQRGEAACMDKWTRAEIALRCGADAVFELPALFAVRTADKFALGGMAILNGIGCDAVSFGCESDDRNLLECIAGLRENEPARVSERIRTYLDAGMSQTRAQGKAWAEELGVDAELLCAPNTVLAAEYLRALGQMHSKMEVLPVRRRGNYHDEELVCGECAPAEACFSSATAIRVAIRAGMDWHPFVPEAARVHAPAMHAPDDLLLQLLRGMAAEEIACLPDVSEGLEYRMKKCADAAATAEELIGLVKCKRYTRSRIERLCAHALLNLTGELAARHHAPEYARLLGLRSDAAQLLTELKNRSALPIVSGAKSLTDSEIFRLECRATDLRALLCDAPEERRAGQEFTRKFVTV